MKILGSFQLDKANADLQASQDRSDELTKKFNEANQRSKELTQEVQDAEEKIKQLSEDIFSQQNANEEMRQAYEDLNQQLSENKVVTQQPLSGKKLGLQDNKKSEKRVTGNLSKTNDPLESLSKVNKEGYDQDMLRLNEQMATAQENALHLQAFGKLQHPQ